MTLARTPERADGEGLARLPVTLLTGFLGAGKTTLVNRLLTERAEERIAVLVNEFGDVPVDGRLVVRTEEEVVELANGCVCCSIRGDLVSALGKVIARSAGRRRLDRILIETSGLASPGPVLQTLLVEPELAARTRTAGVVTLVHGALILEQLERHPEAAPQVGYADLLVVNHADRCDGATLEEVEATLARIQPGAARIRATRANLDVARVLEGLRSSAGGGRGAPGGAGGGPDANPIAEHVHVEGAGAVTLTSSRPLNLDTLKIWLQFLTSRRSHELWRIKGILHCRGRSESVVVQSVYQFLELGPGEEPPPSESTLVVIGRDLDREELERGWRACL